MVEADLFHILETNNILACNRPLYRDCKDFRSHSNSSYQIHLCSTWGPTRVPPMTTGRSFHLGSLLNYGFTHSTSNKIPPHLCQPQQEVEDGGVSTRKKRRLSSPAATARPDIPFCECQACNLIQSETTCVHLQELLLAGVSCGGTLANTSGKRFIAALLKASGTLTY